MLRIVLILIIAIRLDAKVIGRRSVEESGCSDPVTVAVQLPPDSDPIAYGRVENMRYIGPIGNVEGMHEFEAACADGRGHDEVADEVETRRRQYRRRSTDDGVAEATWEKVQRKRTLHPRSYQWHMHDSGSVATHIRSAWERGQLGNGTVVAVVDDGLAWNNKDLRPGYYAAASANYNNGGRIGDPQSTSGDTHGTAAAGIAGARGAEGPPPGSAACGYGVAPMAKLAGIRLISEPVTDATEAHALSHESSAVAVYSCSWGPQDDATRLDGPQRLTREAMSIAARSGRGGLGCVYVWAGGNGAERGDSSCYDGYASHPDAMAVAAVSHEGRRASYSECGTATFVSAPSSGDGIGITTTDVPDIGTTYGCRDDFGGTSAAAPFVAGVATLIVGANPRLTSRDILSIIAQTSSMIDSSDPGWTRNSAGRMWNPCYGFGLVDAGAAVTMAISAEPGLSGVLVVASSEARTCGTAVSERSGVDATASSPVVDERSLPCFVPDTRGYSLASWVSVGDERLVVERADLTVNVKHRRRGELSFALMSPAGTRFVVPSRRRDVGSDYVDWTFGFVGARGERAFGRWTLMITDAAPSNRIVGELIDWSLKIRGTDR